MNNNIEIHISSSFTSLNISIINNDNMVLFKRIQDKSYRNLESQLDNFAKNVSLEILNYLKEYNLNKVDIFYRGPLGFEGINTNILLDAGISISVKNCNHVIHNGVRPMKRTRNK